VRNRGLVLRLLRDQGACSRAWLTRRSGLSATTITKIVNQLIAEGLVRESGPAAPAGVGRPGLNVDLVPDSVWTGGVQIGVGQVRLGLGDLHGQIKQSDAFTFDPDRPADEIISRIARGLAALGERLPEHGQLVGVGVAAPGPVDLSRRRNVLSINLGWRDVGIADRIESTLGVPVVVDHNVRLMAVAEARLRGNRACPSLAYVYVQTGVGLGWVRDGKPFLGGKHGVSELGHLRVVEKGRRCACGSAGCLETLVSETRLAEQAAHLTADDPGGPTAAALAAGVSPLAAIEAAAAAGNTSAAAVLDEMTQHLTTALSTVVNLLNPELIVIGGVFAAAAEETFDLIRSQLRDKVFPILRDEIRVDRSALTLHPGVAGGITAALDRFVYTS